MLLSQMNFKLIQVSRINSGFVLLTGLESEYRYCLIRLRLKLKESSANMPENLGVLFKHCVKRLYIATSESCFNCYISSDHRAFSIALRYLKHPV